MLHTGMPNNVALGVAGLELKPGDHVCALYPTSAERDDILHPYLRAGLRNGDKCFCVVDCTDPESVLAGLGADIDLGPVLAQQQLDVRTSAETFLREGEFSADRMLEFWDQTIGEALSDEFGLARAVGEMTWASRVLPDVVGYEARLNQFLPRYPQIFLCMYEVARFSGDVLVDILKVHPKVLLGSTVIENPYYIEPDEFLAARQ